MKSLHEQNQGGVSIKILNNLFLLEKYLISTLLGGKCPIWFAWQYNTLSLGCCGRLEKGPSPRKMPMSQSLEPVDVILHDKMDFPSVTKLRISRRGDHPGLSAGP